jgi:hypothetical protein
MVDVVPTGRQHARQGRRPGISLETDSGFWARFAKVSELADAEKMNTSCVSHVLRLTLPSPHLIEAILDGRQPRTMQLQPLMREFPAEWEKQLRHFVGTPSVGCLSRNYHEGERESLTHSGNRSSQSHRGDVSPYQAKQSLPGGTGG